MDRKPGAQTDADVAERDAADDNDKLLRGEAAR
jgi:hypothetical protein